MDSFKNTLNNTSVLVTDVTTQSLLRTTTAVRGDYTSQQNLIDSWCQTEHITELNTKNGNFVSSKHDVQWDQVMSKKKKKKKKKKLLPLLTKMVSSKTPVPLQYSAKWTNKHFATLSNLERGEILLNVLAYCQFDPLWLIKMRKSVVASYYYHEVWSIIRTFQMHNPHFSLATGKQRSKDFIIPFRVATSVQLFIVRIPESVDLVCLSEEAMFSQVKYWDPTLLCFDINHTLPKYQFVNESVEKSMGSTFHDLFQMYEPYAQGKGKYKPGILEEMEEEDFDEFNKQNPIPKSSFLSDVFNSTIGLPSNVAATVEHVNDTVDEVAEELKDISSNAKDTLSDAKEFLGDLKEKVDVHDKRANYLFDLLESKINNLFCFKDVFTNVSNAVSGIFGFLGEYQLLLLTLACCCLVLFYMFAESPMFDVVATLVGVVSLLVGGSYIYQSTKLIAQGKDDILLFFYEIVSCIYKIICGFSAKLASFVDFRKSLSFDSMAKVSRNIKSIADLLVNVPKYTSFITDCFTWIRDQAYLYFTGVPYSITVNSTLPIVSLVVHISDNPTAYSVNAVDCLVSKIKSDMKHGASSPIFNCYSNLLILLEEARKVMVDRQIMQSRGGVSPIVVKIQGISNIGKSTAVMVVAEAVSQFYVGHSSVYPRNTNDDFHSGYDNQFVTVYDDFGQETDSDSKPNVGFMELIAIKNVAPFMLNMADVSQKGQFVFNSGVVFLSTNLEHFGKGIVKSLVHPEALERRFDICIKMTARDTFHVVREFGKTVSIVLNLEGLTQYVIGKYSEHYTREYQLSQVMKDRVDKVLGSINKDQVMAYDVYEAFVRWRAHVGEKHLIKDGDRDLYNLLTKMFDKLKGDVQAGVFLQKMHKSNFAVDGPEAKKLFEIVNDFEIPKPPELKTVDFDAEVLIATPEIFRDYGVKLLKVAKDTKCSCSKGNTIHCKSDTWTLNDPMRKIKFMTDKKYMACPPDLPACPFKIVEDQKIPSYCFESLEDADLVYFIRVHYDCVCEIGKKCSLSHKFNFPRHIQDICYNYIKIQVFNFVCMNDRNLVIPKTWKDTVKSWWSDNKLTTLKYLASAGAIVCGIIGLLNIYKNFVKKTYTAQVSNPPQAIRMNPQAMVPYAQGAMAQLFNIDGGKTDSTARDFMKILIKHEAKVFDDASGEELMSVLFVDGYHFLIMHHVFTKIGMNNVLSFVFAHKAKTHEGFKIKVSELEMVQLPDFQGTGHCDAVLCRLPQAMYVPGLSDIRDRFMIRDDYLKFDGSRIVISILDDVEYNLPYCLSVENVRVQMTRQSYNINDNGVIKQIYNAQGLTYNYGGAQGQCTSPIVAVMHFVSHGRRIAGLHAAGAPSRGIGMGVIVSQEQLGSAFKYLQENSKSGVRVSYQDLHCQGYSGPILYRSGEEIEFEAGVGPMNGLQIRGDRVKGFSNTESKLVMSPIGETGEIVAKKAPAILKPSEINGQIIDPNELALKKFLVPIHRPDPDVLDLCISDIKTQYTHCLGKPNTTPLTIEEVIKGVPGTNITSLNMKTSLGFKFKELSKGQGKHALINFEAGTLKEPLKSAVEKRIDCAKRGVALEAIFEDCLKDEKRPVEKVDKGKTRLFSAGPVDLLIAMKMYFGRFVSWFMENRIDDEAALGINCTSPEWHHLAQVILKFGDNVLDGDFENYDATQLREFLWAVLTIINWWYGEDNPDNVVRTALFYSIIGATHINKGWFYTVFGCNPSGNFLTSIINSIYGQIFFRYCYYSALPVDRPIGAYAFHKHVSLVTFGDDNIQGVSSEAAEFYNPLVLSEVAKSIGMGFTTATKTQITNNALSTIDKCFFLKRAFVYDLNECMYLGPLDLDTILEIVNWCWAKASKREMADSCEQAIRELALHPRDVYQTWSSKILRLARQCNYPGIVSATWAGYRRSMLRGLDAHNENFLMC